MEQQVEAVTAHYDDGREAGHAVERLSAAGVEAGRIRVLGPTTGTGRGSQRGTDKGTARRLGERFLQGIAVGAVVGAVFGAIVLAIVTGPGIGAWLAGALGGAAAGAGLGALAGLQTAPTMSRAWEDTFAPERDGPVTLGIEIRRDGVGGRRSLAEIEETLAATGAREVRRVRDLGALEGRLQGDA